MKDVVHVALAGVRRAQKQLYTLNRMTLQPREAAKRPENARKRRVFAVVFASNNRVI
jgi:hypothetical protein